jgi:hypothetical protein
VCCEGAKGNIGCTKGKDIYRNRRRYDFKNDYLGN